MDLWKHRRYIDLWSLVHFLSGMLLAAGCVYVALGFAHALMLISALLIGWEILEWLAGISETAGNIILDLIIGVAGFLLAMHWYLGRGMTFDLSLTGAIVVVTAVLALWGFLDMKLYGYR